MQPISRKVTTADEARAFIREAIDAGYRAVYLTPAMYRQVQEGAMLPGSGNVLRSVAVYPEALLTAGMALAMPHGVAPDGVQG